MKVATTSTIRRVILVWTFIVNVSFWPGPQRSGDGKTGFPQTAPPPHLFAQALLPNGNYFQSVALRAHGPPVFGVAQSDILGRPAFASQVEGNSELDDGSPLVPEAKKVTGAARVYLRSGQRLT